MTPLRIGVLGAARIVPTALLTPARSVPEVVVTAIAARDSNRARAYAARHGIPRALASYDELIDDPDIDAVYNPLPNGLHCAWTLRALGSGKHVLCEKPLASNASEALQMEQAAVHMLRHLAGAEPEVTRAEARLSSPKVDRCMTADVTFADGRTGRVRCSMFSWTLLDISARVVGDKGEMRVFNPVAPQLYHRLTVRTAEGKRVERLPGKSTYEHQLRAFADCVNSGTPVLTSAADGVANMRVIDRIYEKAGLPLRRQIV
jgi:predicted dehydrogenase